MIPPYDTFHVSNFRRYDYFRGFGKTVLHLIKAKSLALRDAENLKIGWKGYRIIERRIKFRSKDSLLVLLCSGPVVVAYIEAKIRRM
jgi:hypothetical protein